MTAASVLLFAGLVGAFLLAAVAMQCAGERQESGVYRIEPNGEGPDA